MDLLRNKFLRLLNATDFSFKRYLYKINWDDRLIIVKGQRGVGKSTLLLQHINYEIEDLTQALYLTLDDLYFASNTLGELVESFVQHGGKYLYIDEVHRYPNWSTEIKNIYDFYPELRVVATGSSALAIHDAEVDLSRRASVYHLHTLSLREYLAISQGINIEAFSLDDVLQHHAAIALDLNKKFKPILSFNQYLKYGAYPFVNESDPLIYDKLKTVINLIIDNDIAAVEHITYESRIKLKKLLYLISTSVPFKPNISELSQKVGTSRDVLLRQLDMLARADIISLLSQPGTGNSILQKPEKIYISNPTLMYALDERVNKGTQRETFFMNQLSAVARVNYAKQGDFLVDNKYVFEIGGKSKTKKQISDLEHAYVVQDDIEYGNQKHIPLWLFGFLY